MDGWMNGWMDGWMDGWDKQKKSHLQLRGNYGVVGTGQVRLLSRAGRRRCSA